MTPGESALGPGFADDKGGDVADPAARGPRAAANLLLIGPMGAGKSSVARHLAARMRWRVADTDLWVRHDQGRSIAEIFAERGEAFFRDREAAALAALEGRRRFVVATGGGIVLRPENRDRLRSLGCVVWLTASEEVLFERVSRNDRRPLLRTANPRETLAAVLQAREPLYRACGHFQIDTSGGTHAEIAEKVLAGLQTHFPATVFG